MRGAMTGRVSNKGMVTSRALACCAIAGSVAVATAARASVVTFAQFQELDEANNGIKWTVTKTGSTSTGAIAVAATSGAQDVTFSYLNEPSLPSVLLAPIPAKLAITATTTEPASSTTISSNNTILSQPFNGPLTMSITADKPFTLPNSSKPLSNLLTVTINPDTAAAILSGRKSSSAGTLQASYCGATDSADGCDNTASAALTYQSDALDFSKVNNNLNAQSDLSLSLSAIVRTLAMSNGLLKNFTANWTGTFDSDPPPDVAPQFKVDEPFSTAAFGAGLLGLGLARRRRSSKPPHTPG